MPLVAMVVAAGASSGGVDGVEVPFGAVLAFGGVAPGLGGTGPRARRRRRRRLARGTADGYRDAAPGDQLRPLRALAAQVPGAYGGGVVHAGGQPSSSSPSRAWEGGFDAVPELSAARWWAVAFLGVFAGSLGYFLWIWALQRSTPTRSAVFVRAEPDDRDAARAPSAALGSDHGSLPSRPSPASSPASWSPTGSRAEGGRLPG